MDVFTFLKDAFDSSYNGNRAPFPLFVHTPWIEEVRPRGDMQTLDTRQQGAGAWTRAHRPAWHAQAGQSGWTAWGCVPAVDGVPGRIPGILVTAREMRFAPTDERLPVPGTNQALRTPLPAAQFDKGMRAFVGEPKAH